MSRFEVLNVASQTCAEKTTQCVFRPVKNDPEEAEKFVRDVFKHKPHDINLVSTELAPLYGFGPNSSRNILARSRAQSIFVSSVISEPLKEFVLYFIRDQWDLPVAKFSPTIALVHKYKFTAAWAGPSHPVPKCGIPEKYYARFLICIWDQLRRPIGPKTTILNWLYDARDDRDEDEWVDDFCWVFFHTLLYLQLKAMESNKYNASLGGRARDFVNRLKSPKSFFGQISKWIFARNGLGELSWAKY
ncbi:hypothetical protein F5Y12DRAFT_719286 [Xylaria sp. FL1777]|nr:hypothetical protein F5Y12DRAFT_719286 [Xylaria sp. FL1777]